MVQTFEFSPSAQERINALSIQIASLEAQRQQFLDGVIVGLGIDVGNNDISVDLGTMTISIGPKGEGYPLSLEPAAQEKASEE